MRKLITAAKYIKYFFSAKTKHAIHSPFVYELLTKVINQKTIKSEHSEIEKHRTDLLRNKNSITVTDLGAGAKTNKSKQKKISVIVQRTQKNKKYAQLLYRLAANFQTDTIVELGTSLGITSLYLAKANTATQLITIEGCTETAAIATRNFEMLSAKNINLLVGSFDELLPNVIQSIAKEKKTTFIYFDGNHQKEATLRYFNWCLRVVNEKTVFVFDDIRWSEGMEDAWESIKQNPKVTVSVDLFFMGIVFFNPHLQKQNFVLRF
jgi:predicted O-methyltransferase YrrM